MRPWCIWRSDMLAPLLQTAIVIAAIVCMTACTSQNDTTQMQLTAAVTSEVIPTHTSVPVALASLLPTSTPQGTAIHTTSPVPTATQTRAPTATFTAVPTPTLLPTITPVPTPTGPAITIGDAKFAAKIADTPELRSKGLGERDSLAEQTGMLFIFSGGQASSFWMKGMRFPLDFVWIGADCTVVDLTEDVQHSPPDAPSSELEIFDSSSPAAYTFEINAGEISRFGVERGDEVRFRNIESEFAMCCESGECVGN